MQTYWLGDCPDTEECNALGVNYVDLPAVNKIPCSDVINRSPTGFVVRAVKTKEFRPPRRGEWFLSGARPTAYKAYNDLSDARRIMKLVLVNRQRKTIETVVS